MSKDSLTVISDPEEIPRHGRKVIELFLERLPLLRDNEREVVFKHINWLQTPMIVINEKGRVGG